MRMLSVMLLVACVAAPGTPVLAEARSCPHTRRTLASEREPPSLVSRARAWSVEIAGAARAQVSHAGQGDSGPLGLPVRGWRLDEGPIGAQWRRGSHTSASSVLVISDPRAPPST